MPRIRFYSFAYQRDAGKEKPSISRIFFITFAIFGISPVQDAVIIKNIYFGFFLLNLRNLDLLFDIKVPEDGRVEDFQFSDIV